MPREIKWLGSSLADFCGMPDGVRRQFNTKLRYLSKDALVSGVATWSGIGPGGCEFKSGGYRMVITTEFSGVVYVIHAFKKDASRGKKTRKHHSDLVSDRYRALCQEYAAMARKQ